MQATGSGNGSETRDDQLLILRVPSTSDLNTLYTVESTAGRGHYARVKQVLDLRSGKHEAAKVIKKDGELRPEDIANEIKVRARLGLACTAPSCVLLEGDSERCSRTVARRSSASGAEISAVRSAPSSAAHM